MAEKKDNESLLIAGMYNRDGLLSCRSSVLQHAGKHDVNDKF